MSTQDILHVGERVLPPLGLVGVKAVVLHIWNTTPGHLHHPPGFGVQAASHLQPEEVLHLSDLLLQSRQGAWSSAHWRVPTAGLHVVEPLQVSLHETHDFEWYRAGRASAGSSVCQNVDPFFWPVIYIYSCAYVCGIFVFLSVSWSPPPGWTLPPTSSAVRSAVRAQLIISSSLNVVYQLLFELHFLLHRLLNAVVFQKVRPSYLKNICVFFSVSGRIPQPSDSLTGLLWHFTVVNNNIFIQAKHTGFQIIWEKHL